MMSEKAINLDLGLFLARFGLALVFIINGFNKFMNIEGVTGFFASLGLGAFFVYLVATIELLGGAAMLFGMYTKVAGILLAANMLGAIYFVKFAKGFTGGGYQLELMLALVAIAIVFAGSGAWSVMRSKK